MEHSLYRREGNNVGVSEAYLQIQGILAEIMATGSVDDEPRSFAQIFADLETGTITPKDAIERAQGVRDSRQDYH